MRPLDHDDRSVLLSVAEDSIAHALNTRQRRLPELSELTARLRAPGASYVALRRDGRLLGSVGRLEPHAPLGVDVAENAVAAAFDDPRVPPIDSDDFTHMVLQISVVGPLRTITPSRYEEIAPALRPGIDGLCVRTRGPGVNFLPQVWDTVVDADDFVALLWRKADLHPAEWPDGLRIATYAVDEIEAAGPRFLQAVSRVG